MTPTTTRKPKHCSDCVNFWKSDASPLGRCTVALPWWADHALEPLTRKGDEEEFCECFEPKANALSQNHEPKP
jgi:hypothetical protein